MVAPLEFFKALGVGIFIVIIVGWILFMIFYVLRFLYKKLKYKYKKWSESEVEWCMDAIKRDWDESDVYTALLVKGWPKGKVKDMIYLYDQCKKRMKGGNGKNE